MPPRVIAADEEEQFVDVPLLAQIPELQRVIRRRKEPARSGSRGGSPSFGGQGTMPPRVIAAREKGQFGEVALPGQEPEPQKDIRARKEPPQTGRRGGSPGLGGQVTMRPGVIAADEEEQFVDVPLLAQIPELQRVIRRRKEPARSGSRGGSPSLGGRVTMPPRVIAADE